MRFLNLAQGKSDKQFVLENFPYNLLDNMDLQVYGGTLPLTHNSPAHKISRLVNAALKWGILT